MRPRHFRGAMVVSWFAFFAILSNLCAQDVTAGRHVGFPQDWSERQIVFSRDALARHTDLIYREPRVLNQAMQRWQIPNWGDFQGVRPVPISQKKRGFHRDWEYDLEGRVLKNMFPAKYSFDPGSPPDCANDYVVFGLGVPGVTGGNANLVAFNNLYVNDGGTGTCSGTAPNVLFAYNITTAPGGRIDTSPVLSLDGTQIAFVESVPGSPGFAIFHVLTWHAGDGTAPDDAVAPANITSLTFSPIASDNYSSPWVDYSADIAYVGNNNGVVYQITNVFNGTPTLSGSPWPVTLKLNTQLSSPVLDAGLGLLMVGGATGDLYQINTTTGGFLALPVGVGTSSQLVAPPIVDVTNGTTFVVNPDGNSGTSAVLEEVDTASLDVLATGLIGLGASGGTKLKIYQPAFSNDYYNDPSTGIVSVCGTGAADTTPWQYVFGFSGRTMNTPFSFSQQLLTSTAAQCSGWTEFFNPNVGGSAGTDFFFFGLSRDCTVPGGGTQYGCVAEIIGGTGPMINPATVYSGPSGIVIDNYSPDSQASSIYFTAISEDIAYKFTQNGLN
ncbi:MAG: hypothetical protein ABSC07_16190 [Terriglobales bacterium]